MKTSTHKFVDGSLVTSVALTPELRKEIIKAVHNERKVSQFVREAVTEKLKALGYLQEQKPEPVAIKQPETQKPQLIYSGGKPIAVTEIL